MYKYRRKDVFYLCLTAIIHVAFDRYNSCGGFHTARRKFTISKSHSDAGCKFRVDSTPGYFRTRWIQYKKKRFISQ